MGSGFFVFGFSGETAGSNFGNILPTSSMASSKASIASIGSSILGKGIVGDNKEVAPEDILRTDAAAVVGSVENAFRSSAAPDVVDSRSGESGAAESALNPCASPAFAPVPLSDSSWADAWSSIAVVPCWVFMSRSVFTEGDAGRSATITSGDSPGIRNLWSVNKVQSAVMLTRNL